MRNRNFGAIIIGGPAGYGIIRGGWFLGKAFSLSGLYVHIYREYPSLIQGGHNFAEVVFSPEPIHSHWPTVDMVIAFDERAIKRQVDKIEQGGVLMYDSTRIKAEPYIRNKDVQELPIPFTKLLRENELPKITMNVLSLGATLYLLRFDIELLHKAIRKIFAGREKIIEMNIKAANVGMQYAEEYCGCRIDLPFKPNINAEPKTLISGNEAISLGAIAGGVTFYSAYPMTPASPILHYLVNKQYDTDMIVIQPENEIAAILQAIGASYAGARAMTATSGGGFSLMTEALGLAAMSETPIVIVLAQRQGPSTGLATHTSQGDLRFVLHASQGEFPRFVIAPGDVNEAFFYTQVALNLAEKYQVPVILIEDKHLGEDWWTTDEDFSRNMIPIERGKLYDSWDVKANGKYKRFKITEDGVSPRVILGTKNAIVKADGNEHTEEGYTSENPDLVVAMNDKRWRKFEYMKREMRKYNPVKIHGDEDARICAIGWGSTKGVIIDAMKLLNDDGIKTKFMQVIFMSPFPDKEVSDFVNSCDQVIDIENNKTSQLAGLVREHTGYYIEHRINKYNGRMFNQLELYEMLKRVIK